MDNEKKTTTKKLGDVTIRELCDGSFVGCWCDDCGNEDCPFLDHDEDCLVALVENGLKGHLEDDVPVLACDGKKEKCDSLSSAKNAERLQKALKKEVGFLNCYLDGDSYNILAVREMVSGISDIIERIMHPIA